MKVPRIKDDIYGRPYRRSILHSVKRILLQDCLAFELPESQQLSVLHIMFKENDLRYFTHNVKPNGSSVDEAFQKLQNHFNTPV